jgi:phosphonate C-P lyase system protein PhnH
MIDAHDSARNFRALMEAMARPGKEQMLAPPKQVPSGLSAGMAACLLVLCDQDVGVHLAGKHDQPEIRDWILFHCGSRLVQASDADFALGHFDDLHPFDAFSKGDPQYPDRSATLIIEQESCWEAFEIQGPGIKDSGVISLPRPDVFIHNRQLFPLGHDFLFTKGDAVTALPRSSMIRGA